MKHTYFHFAILIFIFISGCEGPKGDPGPIGIPSPPPTQAKQGFIRGELSTKIGTNTEKFKFDFQGKNYGDENYYEIINDTVTKISVGKIYAKDGEPYITGKCLLAFNVKNLKDLTIKPITVQLNSIQLNFRKDMTKSQLLDVGVYSLLDRNSAQMQDSISFTEVKYDSITRIIQGKFYAKVFQRDATEKDIYANTISNGTFSAEIFRQLRNNKKIE